MNSIHQIACASDDFDAVKFRLERVFNVCVEERDEIEVTRLSIAFDGQEVRDLLLLGKVELAAGSNMTAVLSSRGNWAGLLAMRDHTRGRTFKTAYGESSSCLLMLMIVPLIVVLTVCLVLDSSRGAWLTVAFACAYGIWAWIHSTRRQAALEQAVRAQLWS